MAAWKRSQQAAPHERQPHFTIDNVAINGRAGGDHAELRFDVTVRLLADEPVEVPLGLIGAILRGQPRFGPDAPSGDGKTTAEDGSRSGDATRKEFLDFDPGRGGFVAHLAGRAGQRRTVSLDLLVPLVRDGTETTLALNCPRALVAAMTLDVEGPVSEASVSNGVLLSREPREGGGTRLTSAGLAGQFRLTWSTAEVAATELSTVLSATRRDSSVDRRPQRADRRAAHRAELRRQLRSVPRPTAARRQADSESHECGRQGSGLSDHRGRRIGARRGTAAGIRGRAGRARSIVGQAARAGGRRAIDRTAAGVVGPGRRGEADRVRGAGRGAAIRRRGVASGRRLAGPLGRGPIRAAGRHERVGSGVAAARFDGRVSIRPAAVVARGSRVRSGDSRPSNARV